MTTETWIFLYSFLQLSNTTNPVVYLIHLIATLVTGLPNFLKSLQVGISVAICTILLRTRFNEVFEILEQHQSLVDSFGSEFDRSIQSCKSLDQTLSFHRNELCLFDRGNDTRFDLLLFDGLFNFFNLFYDFQLLLQVLNFAFERLHLLHHQFIVEASHALVQVFGNYARWV